MNWPGTMFKKPALGRWAAIVLAVAALAAAPPPVAAEDLTRIQDREAWDIVRAFVELEWLRMEIRTLSGPGRRPGGTAGLEPGARRKRRRAGGAAGKPLRGARRSGRGAGCCPRLSARMRRERPGKRRRGMVRTQGGNSQ